MPTTNAIALELINELQEDSGDLGLVAAFEKRVNNALDEIAIATEWNHFRLTSPFSTVVNQAQYQLPQGGRDIVQLRRTDTGEPINHWTIQEAARRGIKIEDSGPPQFWIEDGVLVSGSNVLYQFKLIPKPNVVVQIEQTYLFHPSDVPSGTVFPIQDQLIVPVKDWVKAQWYEHKGYLDRSDRCQRRFEKNLAKLVKKENRKVAARTALAPNVDIAGIKSGGRWKPLDPSHNQNPWWW